MVRMLPLSLFFAIATLISADSPCETAGPPVDTTAKPNMNVIIGGSVAGAVAVAAGIGAIVGWEQRHDGRRRKDISSRRRSKEPNWPEEACTPFSTVETCPTPKCEWTGTTCESPCTPFVDPSTCLAPQCEWRGTSCQVPCTPFTTDLTCPSSQCRWNGTSSSCQALCTDFTTMAACGAAQCAWTGTLCVDPINSRVVVPSNETAAASSSSASASNPWLWVGLALLACGLAVCTAAALIFFCGQPAKKPKKSVRKVIAPEPAAPAEPEVVLPELAPLMNFATPVAAPVYQVAAPAYQLASPVTTVYQAAAPVYEVAAPASTYVIR